MYWFVIDENEQERSAHGHSFSSKSQSKTFPVKRVVFSEY